MLLDAEGPALDGFDILSKRPPRNNLYPVRCVAYYLTGVGILVVN